MIIIFDFENKITPKKFIKYSRINYSGRKFIHIFWMSMSWEIK